MNAPTLPFPVAASVLEQALSIRVPVNATECPEVPNFFDTTAGAVAITLAAIANELRAAGLQYERAVLAARCFLADGIEHDATPREWDGCRMVTKPPRWWLWINGERYTRHFPSRDAALREIKSHVRIFRTGTREWRAISAHEDIERYDRIQRASREREAQEGQPA